MEFLKTAVNETICLIVAAIAEQASYPFQIENNLRDLKAATGDLEAMKEDVKIIISNADRENRAPTKQVQEWLKKAEEIIQEAEQILVQYDNRCRKFVWSNHAFGRNVMKKIEEVNRLCSQKMSIVMTVQLPAPLALKLPISSSKSPMLESAIKYIKDDSHAHDIIGICGVGGVGKTHLLKQINNELCRGGTFDVVIFLTCSNECSDLENIQNQIIRKLGLNYCNDINIEQKQIMIFNFLRKRNFALLLDNVTSAVDLESLGIPNYRPSDQTNKLKGKVVLTTRSTELCNLMEVNKNIILNVLNRDMAWKLFIEKVTNETVKSHPLVGKCAAEIVEELGGVPAAIINVGRAMRGKKNPGEWKIAVELIKQARVRNVELEKPGWIYELLRKACL